MEKGQQPNITEELNYYKSLIDSTERQISNLENLAQEITVTIAVLEDEALFKSQDKKISIGSGIFMTAKLSKPESLFVPIGSDVYVEEPPEKVLKRLKENTEQIAQSLASLYDRRKDLTNRYESLVMLLQRAGQQQGKEKNA